MQKRYLVGGPNNSGKSTFVLSLVAYLRSIGLTAEAIELDVWGNSYPAFRGKYSFKDRPKQTNFNWNWEPAVAERIKKLASSRAEYVFGDMPGRLSRSTAYICENSKHKATGALIVSRTVEGLLSWRTLFDDWGYQVFGEAITLLNGPNPIVMTGFNRDVSANKPGVHMFVEQFFDTKQRRRLAVVR